MGAAPHMLGLLLARFQEAGAAPSDFDYAAAAVAAVLTSARRGGLAAPWEPGPNWEERDLLRMDALRQCGAACVDVLRTLDAAAAAQRGSRWRAGRLDAETYEHAVLQTVLAFVSGALGNDR